MRAIVLGLLITCVPVCFASSQASTQVQQKQHIHGQTAQEIQVEKKKPSTKLQSNKPKVQTKQGQPVEKIVRTVKKDGTIVEEHHIYHHYDQPQPKRVVVRRVPQQHAKRVVVRHYHGAPRHHSAPPRVVRHYHREEPRVVYAPRPAPAPAPVQMSIGYTFG
jgi:hypothetical protein